MRPEVARDGWDGQWRACAALVSGQKGGPTHTYQISREGIHAIEDYLVHERAQDAGRWPAPALFLAAATVPRGTGRLTVRVINMVWNAICGVAQVLDNR